MSDQQIQDYFREAGFLCDIMGQCICNECTEAPAEEMQDVLEEQAREKLLRQTEEIDEYCEQLSEESLCEACGELDCETCKNWVDDDPCY